MRRLRPSVRPPPPCLASPGLIPFFRAGASATGDRDRPQLGDWGGDGDERCDDKLARKEDLGFDASPVHESDWCRVVGVRALISARGRKTYSNDNLANDVYSRVK